MPKAKLFQFKDLDSLNSQAFVIQQHMKSKKHLSAVQAQKQAGQPAPPSATARTLLVPRPVLEHPPAPSLPRPPQEEAINNFHCKLCNVRCPNGFSLQVSPGSLCQGMQLTLGGRAV